MWPTSAFWEAKMRRWVLILFLILGFAIAQQYQPTTVIEYIANTLDYVDVSSSQRCEDFQNMVSEYSFPNKIDSFYRYWNISCYEGSWESIERLNIERVVQNNKWIWTGSWKKSVDLLTRTFIVSKSDSYSYDVAIIPDGDSFKSRIRLSAYSYVTEAMRAAERKCRVGAAPKPPASEPLTFQDPNSTPSDPSNFIARDYAYVSAREVATEFNWKLRFESGKLVIDSPDHTGTFKSGSNLFVNEIEQEIVMPGVAQVNNGVFMIPARVFMAFDCKLEMIPNDPFSVLITCPKKAEDGTSSMSAFTFKRY
jgi:hypothetical protein